MPPRPGARPRAVVIGGGLAGAATAWALARRGHAVTVLEAEPVRGAHASGRNAGLIRRVVAEPTTAELCRRGAALLTAPPPDLAPAPLVRATGSYLLAGPGPAADALAAAGDDARAHGGATELRDAADLPASLPVRPPAGGLAAWTPADGVADPHAVLSALLAAAAARGAIVRTAARVAGLETTAGRVTGVTLAGPAAGAPLPADVVVNAAGAWAAELAARAGALALPLASYRRHLFWTGPLPGVDPAAPWVWDVDRGFYARPESGGLLLCACDEDPRPPEDARPRPDAADLLAEKAARVAPELADLPLARTWAGLRGFVPDGRFVVGWDPQLDGLFWVTALGGHGLTTSCATGALAAAAIAGDAEGDASLLRPLDPARFAGVAASGGAS